MQKSEPWEPRQGVIVLENLRFHPSTRIRWTSVFKNLHPGKHIWKPPFSVPANAGYVWMVAVFGEKTLRFRKYPATCGQALNVKNVAPGTKQRCLQGFSRAKTQIQDVQVLEMWKFNSRTFKDRPIPAYPRDTVWLVFSTIFTIRTLMVRMIWGPSSNCINLSSNRAEISTWCMIE